MLLLGALSRSCQSLALNEVSKVARSSLVSTKNSFTCAPHIAKVLSSRTDTTGIVSINYVGLTPLRIYDTFEDLNLRPRQGKFTPILDRKIRFVNCVGLTPLSVFLLLPIINQDAIEGV